MSNRIPFPLRHVLAVGLLSAATFALPSPSWAAATATTAAKSVATPSLDALLKEATERHPGVREAQQRYEAARARVSGQGLRPDPMIEAGAMSLVGLMGPQVSVSQTFPLGGKLQTERQAAEADVAVAYQAYRVALNEVLAQVREAYYDLYVYQQAAALVERNKQLLGQMSRIASARYAVGQGKQSDLIRINTQLAEMLREAVVVRQQRESASVRLMGLLNRPIEVGHIHSAEGPIPTPVNKPFTRAASDVLAEATASNPGILQAHAELAAGEAALGLARTLATPDVTAKLGVGRSYMDMGWQTVVTGMVGANIPIGSQARGASAVAAAEAELAARRSAVENQLREVTVQLQDALTHVRHLEEQVKLYTKGVLPQARQALQSELANYQVGRSDFVTVLSAQMDLYRYERDYQQAIADYQKMLAEIDALTAQGLPPVRHDANAALAEEAP